MHCKKLLSLQEVNLSVSSTHIVLFLKHLLYCMMTFCVVGSQIQLIAPKLLLGFCRLITVRVGVTDYVPFTWSPPDCVE